MCLDEHMDPRVVAGFLGTFRTIEVAQPNRLKGRDKSDFISELYRGKAVFVTSNGIFVNDAVDKGLKHAGILFVPEQMTVDEKVLFAKIIGGGFVCGACSALRFVFRGRVLYPGHDGLRTIVSRKDSLVFSWDWLSQMMYPREW
jgi:hypothetical protein